MKVYDGDNVLSMISTLVGDDLELSFENESYGTANVPSTAFLRACVQSVANWAAGETTFAQLFGRLTRDMEHTAEPGWALYYNTNTVYDANCMPGQKHVSYMHVFSSRSVGR